MNKNLYHNKNKTIHTIVSEVNNHIKVKKNKKKMKNV
jgi:hypothetical protein